jgi:hypothetical protein
MAVIESLLMSLSEIIEELPLLSREERWQVIERAMELDDISDDELQLINERIAAHERAPETSVPLAQMAAELREQYRL